MSPEAALLQETWTLVKTHIHSRERGEIAEALLELFDDHIGLGDLEVYRNEFDRSMKSAIISYLGEDDPDDEEW
jgi:hypothetical protein